MAIVDKKTPRLGLLLPNADNFLQDDVERLIQSFDLLDVLVVMRDQTTGKIADDQLSEVIARLDAQGKISTSALPSSVVQKGADGKIDSSVLPSIAIIDSFPVPNEASMLGLQCERGDIAIRTDLGRSFILTDLPPSKLSNWRELTSTNVTSVNGQVGAITGLAKAGVNDDITQLTALSGPLRLGGDAVGDYDAVTMRQLRSVSGGAGGPSMNGVMNNFIGAVEWFNGSRAKLPAGYIPADGQKVLKTDQPDLWAAVNTKMLTSTNEATWQADRTKRACYAYDTSTTEFRVPDLNGQQSGSITGAFLRGHSAAAEAVSGAVGEMRVNAAPNITATTNTSVLLGASMAGPVGGGAFTPKNSVVGTGKATTTGDTPITYMNPLDFNASLSNAAYGRDSTPEVRPNSAVGIWIIRASGGFVAANTSWSVINGDATRPPSGTTVDGGHIISKYQINGVDEATASLLVRTRIDNYCFARLVVEDATSSNAAWYDFNADGGFSAGSISTTGDITAKGSLVLKSVGYPNVQFMSNRYNNPNTNVGALTLLECSGTDGTVSNVTLIRRLGTGSQAGQVIVTFPTTTGTLALQGTSGLEYKKDITDADAQEAMDRINGQRLVNFVYKDDEQERVRFGIIAEEAELIAPQYIKHNQEPYEDILDEDGNKIGEKTRDRPSVDVNPIVMDLMGCVQALNAKIAALDAEIAELKASK